MQKKTKAIEASTLSPELNVPTYSISVLLHKLKRTVDDIDKLYEKYGVAFYHNETLTTYLFNEYLDKYKGSEPSSIHESFYTIDNFSDFLQYLENNRQQEKDIFKKQHKTIVNANKQQSGKLSIPQTAILCYVLDIGITNQNAGKLLTQYSAHNSTPNLVRNRINKKQTLTAISENKTADTKRKNNLLAVKQYISSMKNETALTSIDRIITAFNTNYDNFYTD